MVTAVVPMVAVLFLLAAVIAPVPSAVIAAAIVTAVAAPACRFAATTAAPAPRTVPPPCVTVLAVHGSQTTLQSHACIVCIVRNTGFFSRIGPDHHSLIGHFCVEYRTCNDFPLLQHDLFTYSNMCWS